MNTVAAELETLLQILLITHRLTEAEVEAIRRAKRNPVLLAVVEQFRVDHDLTEAADTLRYTDKDFVYRRLKGPQCPSALMLSHCQDTVLALALTHCLSLFLGSFNAYNPQSSQCS